MKSSIVRRGKTRNAMRFGGMASAGLDRGLVALGQRLIAFRVRAYPALGRRARERSWMVTSPTTTAGGATNAVGCTFGLLPSKLNSGMGWTPAVSSKPALILLERDATGGGNAVSEDRGCRHCDASSSVHAGAPARARQLRRRGATRILSPQRHRRPSSVDRSGNLPA